MSTENVFTDRYAGNYPDPETVCQGDCEGMGCYPEKIKGAWGWIVSLFTDGCEFVECPDCNGTGKRSNHASA